MGDRVGPSENQANTTGAYPGFRSMKLTSIATPPGWDAGPSQVNPQHCVAGTHLYSWPGGERHCESRVSCPRTQHNDPGQGSNPEKKFFKYLKKFTKKYRFRSTQSFGA